MFLTRDKDLRAARNIWRLAQVAELQYSAKLRSIAAFIGDIIDHYLGEKSPFDPSTGMAYARDALNKYSEAIGPWARSVANAMLADVERRNWQSWQAASRSINRNLIVEINRAPIGERYKQLMEEQVTLIKSIPLDAAEKVHELVTQNISQGNRVTALAPAIEAIAAKIPVSERIVNFTRAKAVTIARTEVNRASTTLLQARAEHIGSPGYNWRTVGDADVRHDHKILNGTYHRWDDPPIADQRTGARAHPGCIYNCRCFADPVIPDAIERS